MWFYCNHWKVKVKSLSSLRLLATPWTAAYQALPSMGFSRQEHWSGVPLPSPYFSNLKEHCNIETDCFKFHDITYICVCLVAQSCPTVCNHIYLIVLGILHDRMLDWVTFPFCKGSSQPMDQTQVSCTAGKILYHLNHQGSPPGVKYTT